MYPEVYHSFTLPVKGEMFVGRDTEVEELTDLIGNSAVSIVSIVGSPGFGKSTLAIHVGHVITERGGEVVHYVDLCEVEDMTTLNEKLTFVVLGKKRRSNDYLYMWASKLKVHTLLIFDNCDELLHKRKDTFQNLMKNFVRQSQFLKIMLTAKQMTSFLDSFRNFTVRGLTTDSAVNLLQKRSSKINRTMALEIAGLVGNVPLALQVIGSLLKNIDPSIIANDLRRDPIPALSPELLPSTERVYTSLNISYHYLSPEHQKCGRLLAIFLGSFDENSVQYILQRESVQDPSKCFKELYFKSLLSYDARTLRYRFHKLVKEFFTYEERTLLIQNKSLFSRFIDYYGRFGFVKTQEPLKEMFHLIDEERSKIDFLLTLSHKINPILTEPLIEISAQIVFNSTITVLEVLRFCKTLHLKDPLSGALMRLIVMNPNLHVGSADLVSDTRKSMPDFLQDQRHQLFSLAHIVLKLSEDVAAFQSRLSMGDIHSAISLGIDMGQRGLFEFDSHSKSISMEAGLSQYFERYVNLLVQLSKLEAIINGRQKALDLLMLRYKRVAQLFSFTSANDLQMYIKYQSALAHNYILLGQFDHFLEQWKKIIQLKWSPAQCKQLTCTPTHLALAHFGQGEYEESAEQMETLLHSTSLQGNRRVQLFILLHESYMRLGNVKRAAQLLTKDHYLSRFPSIRTIKATDYVNNSTNLFIVYQRYQRDHSTVWLLNRECMTISSDNYRTCFILAAFYRSLGSRDGTKLGRVLHHVLGHHFERHLLFRIQWWDYEVYSKESSSPVISAYVRSNFGNLLTMALFFICILCVAALGCTVILHL